MNNSSHADTTSATSRLALSICGYPTFCSVKSHNVCTDSPLGECSECRTLNTKIADIRRWKTDSYGSAIANVGGMGFMLFYASSLNHLCYMTIQRFIAVKWPHYYNEQTLYSIYFHLLIVWAYSVLIASIPGKVLTYNIDPITS
ncbi:unnamed protein product [Clavelina lepadiformis]|uniref:Uncharacterized protein n=1 Tax=Clavelina lepadiformis TaxID=159417 RepID=A0ABP0GIY0_CLALP